MEPNNSPAGPLPFDDQGLDLSKVFLMTKEQADKYAQELESTGEPDKLELAETLRDLPEDFFELSKGESLLKEFGELLKAQKVDEEKITEILDTIIATATHHTMLKIEGLMNEEVKANWREVLSHSPNMYQLMILLDHISKELGNKTFDDMYDESVKSMIDQVSVMLIEGDRMMDNYLSKVPAEYLKEIEKLFDSGQYERAVVLIYQYANNVN